MRSIRPRPVKGIKLDTLSGQQTGIVRIPTPTTSPAILTAAYMSILFAISVAAFVAIMWASIATARHIRLARRRRRMADEAAARPVVAASGWGTRESRPDWTAVAPHLAQAPTVRLTQPPPAPVPEALAVLDEPEQEVAAPPPPPAAAAPPPMPRFPLSSQRRASSTQIPIAVVPQPAAPIPPVPAPERPRLSADQLTSSAAQFQLRRPPVSAPAERGYFNADGADLSDPEPQRFRDRSRQR